ncbi:unnamed protein product [Paramecium pentaurelia]|uniref:Uncharacterized protein n=1 Tax=Paramecium pentaurelia TaxID=43138 RepID=A0A8S1YKJ5_9CILI|nr:unnamed protein product [Paramecium pentaurelia]
MALCGYRNHQGQRPIEKRAIINNILFINVQGANEGSWEKLTDEILKSGGMLKK